MNKLNIKLFKQITGEPIEVQQTDKGVVEIHSLNNSVLYDEYISKGKFFFWCSDGNVFRLVIEEGYYETLKDFFVPKVNEQWIRYYDETDAVRNQYMKKYLFPAMILYVIISFLVITLLPDFSIYVFGGLLLIIVFLSKVFSNKLNNEFNLRHNEATATIKRIVGKKEYKELLDKQEKYRKNFYKFEDDEDLEEAEEATEAIEVKEESEEV